MQRNMMMLVAVVGTVLILTTAGCKDNLPESALDQFIAQTGHLEGEALEDTLRVIAAGEPPFAVFANYLLGNKYYKAAGDTAAASGWGDGQVNALLDTAETFYSRAIAQDSTFIEALVNLGSLWDDRSEQMGSREERQERLANAERFYRLALRAVPEDEKARCNLGSLYLRQRQKSKALEEFNTALEYNPQSALAHYNLAIMFAEEKIYREAMREWELAVKHDPDGDIGERSRANIQIVKDLMNAPDPVLEQ